MIGEHLSATTFTLVRNPQFRPWSFAAQPEGYPDRIEWKVEPDLSLAVRNVVTGVTDADERASAAADYATVLRTNPDHFRSDFTARTSFLFLNTKIAPFNNPDVRKAINYAVDRNKIAELVGGASAAAPTCQILPPNFPGYRRYCPYTVNPTADGRYHGPDLATATALVNRSGTHGQTVTVVSYFDDPPSIATAEYLVGVLNRLGYKAKFAASIDDNYFSQSNSAQIGTMLWIMDYPAPTTFFATLRCRSDFPAGTAIPARTTCLPKPSTRSSTTGPRPTPTERHSTGCSPMTGPGSACTTHNPRSFCPIGSGTISPIPSTARSTDRCGSSSDRLALTGAMRRTLPSSGRTDIPRTGYKGSKPDRVSDMATDGGTEAVVAALFARVAYRLK